MQCERNETIQTHINIYGSTYRPSKAETLKTETFAASEQSTLATEIEN